MPLGSEQAVVSHGASAMVDGRAADGRGAGPAGADGPPARSASANRTLLRGLLVFAAIAATGVIGLNLPAWGGRVALPLLPSGIAVAALVRWGRGLWPAVYLGELVIDLVLGRTPGQSLLIACGLPAGAWFTAWVLERRGFDADFRRARDLPRFLWAVTIGMTLPGTFGMLGLLFGPVTPDDLDFLSWFRWWGNTSAGVLLIGPLLLTVRRESLRPLLEEPLPVLALIGAVLVIALAFAIAPDDASQAVRAPVIVLAVVVAVLSAMRFGLVVSSTTALLLSTMAALGFTFNWGLMRGMSELDGLVMLWSFVGAMSGGVLIVTALLAERDAAAAERLRAERRYAEVFEASPQPLWVHDPVSLRFLLVNQATERQYGHSREFLLGMRVTDLAAAGEERAVPGPDTAPGNDHEPFETRHLTRDGRVLEIEMWTRPIDFGGQNAVLAFATDVTERKALGRALIDAIAGEQRRIGQEMHDGLGQELTGLSLSLRALANRAGRDRLPFAADLDQLAGLVSACIQSARRIVHGLSPLSGADGNLVAALTHLADSGSAGGLEVHVRTDLAAPLTLPLEARNHLFRIAQEALQNAQKHSGARRIDIELSVRTDRVRLAVSDDGRGAAELPLNGSGLGMRTMRYRAASIGGRLTLRTRSPSGTVVLCDAPQGPPHATARSA
jgi:PAS domain S-box-containing protein